VNDDGRHPSAGPAHGPAFRPEAAPAVAADVSESSERPRAVLLLPAGASGHPGPVDNPAHPRLQLRAGAQDPRQPQQVARLLLPGAALQKRHAAAAAGDVTAAGVAGSDATTRHDDDGTTQRTSQELGRSQQERAFMHVRRWQNQVAGRRQERSERVGRLPRRERQSSAEGQP